MQNATQTLFSTTALLITLTISLSAIADVQSDSKVQAEQADTPKANTIWRANSTQKQFDLTATAIEKSSRQPKNETSFSEAREANSPQQAPALSKTKSARISNINSDFWIYDAWLALDFDTDFDGYFSRITLEFDADTVYAHADVYARLYLARTDTYQEYYTTSVFSINGESSLDVLEVESDLLEGFPPGDYALLIELYDADTDQLVAISDEQEDADLSLIPLESQEYEVLASETTVVISRESGGSTSWLGVLAIAGVLVCRRALPRARQ